MRPVPRARDASRAHESPFRFEPLGPSVFPVGDGPFRARGLAYLATLEYVDKRLSGGRSALVDALGPGDPWASYLDQICVATGEYDVSPLLRVYLVGARQRGVSAAAFIERRAAGSGAEVPQHLWKALLGRPSTEAMAERMHVAFNRYFPPCEAHPIAVKPGRFEGELSRLPAPMCGLYTAATSGFWLGALPLAGGSDIRATFEAPVTDGELRGVPLVKVRFAVTWSG